MTIHFHFCTLPLHSIKSAYNIEILDLIKCRILISIKFLINFYCQKVELWDIYICICATFSILWRADWGEWDVLGPWYDVFSLFILNQEYWNQWAWGTIVVWLLYSSTYRSLHLKFENRFPTKFPLVVATLRFVDRIRLVQNTFLVFVNVAYHEMHICAAHIDHSTMHSTINRI